MDEASEDFFLLARSKVKYFKYSLVDGNKFAVFLAVKRQCPAPTGLITAPKWTAMSNEF